MKEKLYYRKFCVSMKNGDTFVSSTQRLTEKELLNFIRMFENIDHLTRLNFDHKYLKGSEISSVEICKPFWAVLFR